MIENVELLSPADGRFNVFGQWRRHDSKEPMNDPIEVFRREQPSMPTTPLNQQQFGILDYSVAAGKIDRAVHHLDEGLPTGQRQRCEQAFKLLREGVEELGVWMRATGYTT